MSNRNASVFHISKGQGQSRQKRVRIDAESLHEEKEIQRSGWTTMEVYPRSIPSRFPQWMRPGHAPATYPTFEGDTASAIQGTTKYLKHSKKNKNSYPLNFRMISKYYGRISRNNSKVKTARNLHLNYSACITIADSLLRKHKGRNARCRTKLPSKRTPVIEHEATIGIAIEHKRSLGREQIDVLTWNEKKAPPWKRK